MPQRLTTLDASFLYLEEDTTAMHVGSLMTFASLNRYLFLFVIPSEAEGSAVLRTHRVRSDLPLDMTLSYRPERIGFSCRAPRDNRMT